MNLYQDLTNAINTGSVKLVKSTSDEFIAINQDGARRTCDAWPVWLCNKLA